MRRVLIAIAVCTLIAVGAQDAYAQCSISTLEVNGVTTLCAMGGDAWAWTGPGGFTATDMCITASAQGLYTLRVFDATAGTWSDPCSQQVGNAPPPPACSIQGADSVCVGSSVSWCGPTGNFGYSWVGPSGFAASSACVDLSAAGLYALTVTDLATGASSDPCVQTLRVVDCSAPHTTDVCPRSARWWAFGCSDRQPTLNADAFSRVAAGVDARSGLWDYGGTAQGLCGLLARQRHASAMSAAKRQYAALLANLTAAALGITDNNGQTIGLDPNRVIEGVRGVPVGCTVGQWASATEQALTSMAASSKRSDRDNCRRIRRQAIEINAGARSGACYGQMSSMADDDDEESGEPDSPTSFSAGGTGPLSGGGGRMRWTLTRADQVELSVVDITGRRIRHLVSGVFSAGTHEFTWDGRDDDGRAMRAGAYFVAGTIGGQRTSQRLFILR